MGKRGKPHKPTDVTRDFVMRCLKAGCTRDTIADAMDITDDTLRKYYQFEIKTAAMELKAMSIGVIDHHLEDNNLEAAKFVLSRRAGWAETTKSEIKNDTKTTAVINMVKPTATKPDLGDSDIE